VWSARAVEGTIPPGTEIEVYRIDGAIAIVYPRNLALP
jgi:membrane protein implicated in regulation of membrane protease activity